MNKQRRIALASGPFSFWTNLQYIELCDCTKGCWDVLLLLCSPMVLSNTADDRVRDWGAVIMLICEQANVAEQMSKCQGIYGDDVAYGLKLLNSSFERFILKYLHTSTFLSYQAAEQVLVD
jgi:hypothetical protein